MGTLASGRNVERRSERGAEATLYRLQTHKRDRLVRRGTGSQAIQKGGVFVRVLYQRIERLQLFKVVGGEVRVGDEHFGQLFQARADVPHLGRDGGVEERSERVVLSHDLFAPIR